MTYLQIPCSEMKVSHSAFIQNQQPPCIFIYKPCFFMY